jgi:glutaredoxin domain-containing cysteine-rich protein 1
MIIETLKARILRALKPSSLSAAGDGARSPTKPAHQCHGGDASFFDAREPLDAWELVDDGRAPSPADPLLGFPAAGGEGGAGVVLYTTTLRGVRRTFEDCNGVRALLESLGAPFQERDVSMDRGLRDQLWAAAGEKAVPPRLFVRGRDLGGAGQVLALHEQGRLAQLLPCGEAGARSRCGACAGVGFVVCGACDGSRKAGGDGGGRCRGGCNENGLVMCPLCLSI